MTLHSIMQGIRANEFEWLCVEQPHRVPVSEAKKRQELASQFVHWLFEQHLIPLLQVSSGSSLAPDTTVHILCDGDIHDTHGDGVLSAHDVGERDSSSL